ncbi:signal peptide peptidase SppA [Cnuella takakiae]|uniref:Signal peptide peptidase SppA n=1 Tax=Cnuella takakiae TaxID=1302690 RepID=A0A1M5G1W1_9BACT|nr:S49 family peptidase [Cnuella takakiae]OLY92300.1 hypothetical protein BUE76_10640 [Cnuella takakiae]SHF97718.1 signal peptide peptidase SppA [Cnuella takakiae]
MDYKVASSIYGKPWLIEQGAAVEYISLLENIRQGKASFVKRPSAKLAAYALSSTVIAAPDNRYAAKEHPGYEGRTIAVLPVSGPLMKGDFCGWFGTASLRGELGKMEAAESIKTIVLHVDSPGGSVDGTQALAEAIRNSKKEVVAMVDGVCASAAYWIASQADRIVATSGTDLIGSIGTMFTIQDRSSYMEEMGVIVHEYYATKSTDKNRMFTEAQKGKGKALIQNLLDPLNELFLAAVRTGRGKALNEEKTLTGEIFLAAQAQELGLVDEVASMDATINALISKHSSKTSQITMKKTWAKISAILGLAAFNSSADLQDEHLDKLEASMADAETRSAELTTAQARVKELETAQAADKTRITELEGQLATANTNLTKANADLTKANAEVERLGKLDAGKFTEAKKDGDEFNDSKVDAAAMDFQQELLSKV